MSEGAAPPGWRQELLHRAESFLFWALIQLVARSCRLRVVAGAEHLERMRRDGGVTMIAFWHDRLFFGSYFVSRALIRRGYPVTALISPSRDGELAARTAARLGARVVRGSSSRGARQGVRALLREAAAGRGLVVIPDGPKGPPRRAKPGVVTIARLTGAPVLPFTWMADRSWRLGSWDRLEIPKPFARVAVAVGTPRTIPRDLTDDALPTALSDLEAALAALDHQAATALSP